MILELADKMEQLSATLDATIVAAATKRDNALWDAAAKREKEIRKANRMRETAGLLIKKADVPMRTLLLNTTNDPLSLSKNESLKQEAFTLQNATQELIDKANAKYSEACAAADAACNAEVSAAYKLYYAQRAAAKLIC
jgi:hypothetical protein